ncbi:Retrovirus-related Pol polyprotein from transposon.6 [Sesamum angolense]|uniref:Retrovirus-related Pol polyprotein from transposon.6 n=1 Tax=Sesamum angolense TaxID=2727404 RepID=A0AAE1XIC4_9LAMI|nr:Retrovirus-related Pol polyprotein from transposon.6 [Sesamum angolense]
MLGDNKPFTEVESHFADAKYYIEDAKKEKRPSKSQSHINLKQPLKPQLKGFVPSTQEEEGRHEALAIDEKEFDPKAFKLLLKIGYNPKEKLSLGKLPPEVTGKKLHELNTTQIMLKEKRYAIRDSRDLNNACPRDDFPLPIIELMIDATTDHEALSFIDGLSRYNQIHMALVDEELTPFHTPKGIYCYKVMPFGLKNAGATYQTAMQRIFDDMLHKNVECYIDDLVVKSKKREDHLHDLRKVPQKALKGQVPADFLADSDDLPDEDVLMIEVTPPWKMYFDGASHKEGEGAGVVFVTSEGEVLPYSFTLTQNCSNNVAKYQALILGLEMVVDIKKLHLKVYGDSQIVERNKLTEKKGGIGLLHLSLVLDISFLRNTGKDENTPRSSLLRRKIMDKDRS